jgi:hypothetical protein
MEIEMVRETEMVRDMYMEIVGDGDSRRKMEIKQCKLKFHDVIPAQIY